MSALLACPTSGRSLTTVDGGWRSAASKTDYLSLGTVPFLCPQPEATKAHWRYRYNALMANLEHQLQSAQASMAHAQDLSHTRLKYLVAGLESHLVELEQLLAPLQPSTPVGIELHQALGSELLRHHDLTTYATNIFRDWGWGETENKVIADHLLGYDLKLPEQPKILIIGAGAGKLALDIHGGLKGGLTVALDANPLMCLVAQHMYRGEPLTLTEFPLAPRSVETVAVTQKLCGRQTQGIEVICGDAANLPFLADSFDLVVTPWITDVLEAPLLGFLRGISRVLKPGGYWVNHGSVAFEGPPHSRLLAEELSLLSTQAGFAVQHLADTTLPYLHSPHSRQQRMEMTSTQVAILHDQPKEISPSHTHHTAPDWLLDSKQAIPLSDAFRTQLTTTRINAFIMGLIDGQRSLNDIANVMEEQRLMPRDQALVAVRGFVQKMHEEASASGGYAQPPAD